MKRISVVIAVVIVLFCLGVTPGLAATEEDIGASCELGTAWLASVQKPDGSWGSGYWEDDYGTTGLVLVKLQERAFELGYDGPFDPDYPYKGNVEDGLDYLFTYAANVPISPQPAGNPDTDGDGLGVSIPAAYHTVYETGIFMMAVAAGRDPDRLVTTGPLTGSTYGAALQDAADWMAYAQSDSGYGRGGWYYYAMDNEEYADQSNAGYALLGLLYAQTPKYGYECNIPAFVADELNYWIDYIQSDWGDGIDPDYDGGSGYTEPDYWVNSLKTGTLLTQMAFVGDVSSDTRVAAALDYIGAHWNDNWVQGWGNGGPVQYQAAYCLMKGFEVMGIPVDGVPGVADWFDDMATDIITEQNLDGSWPSSPAYVWYDGSLGHMVTPELSTVWALLTLERFAPPPPVVIEVSKEYTYTSVCFEKDNDADGLFNEDAVDTIDNDGDGLIDEDPIDCPYGTNLGDPLPMDADGNFLVSAVVTKKDVVTSYNPGQYYAVSTINVLADIEMLTIEEDFSDCIDSGISALNPPTGGGAVVVVVVGPEDDVAYQALDAKSPEVTIVDNVATITLGPQEAGTRIYVYVKFSPGLKGEVWSEVTDFDCVNINSAWVVEVPEENDIIFDTATLIVS
ncbi:MAG: hypothetical protein LUQ37_05195 [Methanoregulaceae archaeon]|nr:hypothetical protein [Methanoregulaceae archaeon]